MKFYILDNKQPKPVSTKYEWETWMYHFESSCIISETMVNGIVVSTHFRGCSTEDDPLLFETVIFGGLHDQYIKKFSTWKEAETAHKRAVVMVVAELN